MLENRALLLNAQSVHVTALMPDLFSVEIRNAPNVEQAAQALQTMPSLQFCWLPQLGNESGARRAIWRLSALPSKADKESHPILTDKTTGEPVTAAELDRQVFAQFPVISNKDLLPRCSARMLPGGYPGMEFELTREGAEMFKAFTRHHIGEYLGIFLDKKLLTVPMVNGVIKGKGFIEGDFTFETARSISAKMNVGALPVPLTLLQTQPLNP